MTNVPDPRFLVLHGLRLKGFADGHSLSGIADAPVDDVANQLDHLVEAGFATKRDGRISGWSLTAAGRAEHARLLAAEAATATARERISAAYRDFLDANGDLLAVCTDWQLRDGGLNDHSDADYDRTVIKRLRAVDDAVQPVCRALTDALARFASYGGRLATAVDRVAAGERDWFAKPMIDSYHTVWFELHEDLLVTLGIERAKEGA